MRFAIADAHCDTAYNWAIGGKRFDAMDLTPERIREGRLGVQLMAMYCGPSYPVPDPAGMGRRMLRAIEEICEASGGALRYSKGVPERMPEGYCAAVPSIEGGELLAGSVERLREYAAEGVRAVALTWNHPNDLGTPACLGEAGGLTPLGRTVVDQMRRLGVAADVSHLNVAGFFDVADRLGPFMASHSCARALCEHTRNLTDEQIRVLIEHGGFIGVNFYTRFLTGAASAAIGDVVRHIDHIAQLGGAGIVGFGSDFDGIETAPEGLGHPGRFGSLTEALEKRGYGSSAVEGIAGENFLRFFRRVKEQAEEA